jgi:ssDNA-binding Zn-finger/Zn-ribbon topoisomerase 1
MSEGKEKKLAMLADQYGVSVEELLEEWALDSVVPGICMNPDCEYTAEYEPDQREGWCEACGTPTVQSAFVLLGVI